ncbi:ABC transporter ATP-binding protein [Thermoactinomyces mirandus]|uniref:ABC transporter ATP-binding protein n=1 Tax=Thermoactinomyces mirandus TaxID=2756294 RepID=A0A7W1XPJ0_9BACL|nr:ABC transporter ATP-binding protein [Thermoactinomyces mirandus]MBA4600821.1 ABC transporter ATP-binding protein [Thermoactinomyces mirandus]
MQPKINKDETILSVKKLGKKIGGRDIVRNLSFEVRAGEIFGFLGPNGAGKTTTIRMLVGLASPSEGSIHIAGYDLQKDFMKAISHVGCIVENPELYPYLTGLENLELFARMTGIPDERIFKAVEQVELTDRINDLVRTYSLGMKQRLGIAQALLHQPKLLILDEPTNGLDPAGIRDMRSFVRQLAREEGIGIFISSHILHEIQNLCDRVAIIQNGQLLQIGPIDQLTGVHSLVEWKLEPFEEGLLLLQSLPYIAKVLQTGNSKVTVQMPLDKIAETNHYLLKHDIRVSEISPRRQTLEDLFFDITGGFGL